MGEEPREHRITTNGVGLALYEWPGAGPPVLLVHANGFHARCWDPVVARLPGRRRLALDLRGHGRSEKPAPPYSWPDFAADLAGVAEALDLRGAIGVGHSLGGYALALAAALAPTAFASLLLIDPVILPPAAYGSRMPGVHGSARRRSAWESAEALCARLRDRPPFKSWDADALHAYCDHALLPDPTGGLQLACPPAIEADIYHASTEHAPFAQIAQVRVPVTVVRAHPFVERPTENFAGSPTTPDLAARFPHGRDVHLADHSHFIPMEDPALVARLIAELG